MYIAGGFGAYLEKKKLNKILESEYENTSNQKNAGPYLNFRNKHDQG